MTAFTQIPPHPARMTTNQQIMIARPWVESDPVLTCVPFSPSGGGSTTWATNFAPTSVAAPTAPSGEAASTAVTSLPGALRGTPASWRAEGTP
jgi:hypothetical protein